MQPFAALFPNEIPQLAPPGFPHRDYYSPAPKRGKHFLADLTSQNSPFSLSVWNHPVFGRSFPSSRRIRPSPGTGNDPHWFPPPPATPEAALYISSRPDSFPSQSFCVHCPSSSIRLLLLQAAVRKGICEKHFIRNEMEGPQSRAPSAAGSVRYRTALPASRNAHLQAPRRTLRKYHLAVQYPEIKGHHRFHLRKQPENNAHLRLLSRQLMPSSAGFS